jgi:hypothetical protein
MAGLLALSGVLERDDAERYDAERFQTSRTRRSIVVCRRSHTKIWGGLSRVYRNLVRTTYVVCTNISLLIDDSAPHQVLICIPRCGRARHSLASTAVWYRYPRTYWDWAALPVQHVFGILAMRPYLLLL